jgi:cell division protein FtsZ
VGVVAPGEGGVVMGDVIEAIEGARIKVIGVGGGGGNAVNTMIAAGLPGIDFLAANTDAQALRTNLAPVKLQLGERLTRGLGAGGNPEVGKRAALEDVERLAEHLGGADMIFVTAGMGGGTGTGAAPVVAKVGKELGCLTVGVVTKPFIFEGKRRAKQADEGLRELKASVDTLITIPNQRLLAVAGRNSSIVETFKKADDVLLQAVRGIADLVTVHGLINLDFADVRAIMAEMGMAMMGAAISAGENRAVEAAQHAISSPLLEDVSIKGARGVLINITGGPTLSLHEVNEAATLVQEEADDDANIIFGAVIDEHMGDEVRITVIATGFGSFDRAREPIRPVERETERADARRAGVVRELPKEGGRRVVRLGMIEDGDNPRFVPRGENEGEPAGDGGGADSQYDIPTFLRKQAD